MSTQNDQTRSGVGVEPPTASRGTLVEYDEFIEAQLRKTRSQVRTVDIAGGLMTLAAGGLVFLLAAAMVDHWVVRGGLPSWARWLALAVFLLGGAAYLAASIVPVLVRRINPLYAAEAIERSRPGLKNALVNFLFLREKSTAMPARVFEAVEEQAATNLARVHVDATIDRTRLVRTAYVLAGVLLVAAIYTVFSPKNLLQTAGRIVMPWAQIDAPTRTTIVDIEPGNVQAFRGQQVAVLARVQNLPADAKAMLVYTTADGQTVDRAVPMVLASDGYKHAAVLPPGDSSLQQDLEYRIEAGDAISRRFKLQVIAAPTIMVRSVTYRYPKYTGLLEQRVDAQGDLRAIEGTDVIIDAQANQEITSAYLDFDCNATSDRPMVVSGRDAKVEIRLTLAPDRQGPEHSSYQLIFKNDQGQQNPQPVRHQIEVTPDLPPEVQIVGPKQDELELPADGTVEFEVVANDPDFALRILKVMASVRDKSIVDEMLSSEVQQGQLVRMYRFDAKKHALKSGDVVDYWAVAEDNKQPRANHAETTKRRLRIVSPTGVRRPTEEIARRERPGGERLDGGSRGEGAGDSPKGERAGRREPGDESPEPQKATPGEARDGERSRDRKDAAADSSAADDQNNPSQQTSPERPGKSAASEEDNSKPAAGEPSIPSDGTDDGDAIERILKHREEQSPEQQDPSHSQQRKDSSDESSKGKQGQAGEQGKDQQSAQQSGQQAGDQSSGKQGGQQGGSQSGSDKTSGTQAQNQSKGDSGSRKASDQRNQSGGQGEQSPKDGSQDKRQQGQAKSDKQSSEPSSSKSGQQGDEGGQERSQPSGREKNGKSPADQGQQGKGQQGQGQQGQQGNDSAGKGSPGEGEAGAKQSTGTQGGKNDRAAGQDSRAPQSGDDAARTPDEQSKGEPGKSQGKSESPDADKSDAADERQPDGQSQKQGAEGQSRSSPQNTKGGKSGETSPAEAGEKSEVDEPSQSQSSGAGDKSQPRGAGNDRPRDETKPKRGEPGAGEKDSAGEQKRVTDPQDNATQDKSTQDKASERKPTTGQGAQSKSDPTGASPQKPGDGPQKPDAAGGDGEHDKGNSGAGHSPQDTKGSPNAKQTAKPTKKNSPTTKDPEDPKHEDEGQAASKSDRESSTQSEEDGEYSGGGKRGGGQQANKQGTGGPGQNTAADEGAGIADERGQGETSDRAGRDRQSNRPTGQSGSKRGQGSGTQPGTEGDKPEGGGESKELGSQSSGRSSPTAQPGEGSESTGPPQGGKPGGAPADQQWKPGTDHADEANLEYARKATELALQHLKDELKKDRPDPQLLERLGWTAHDLENFVKRWEQMRDQARSGGETGLAARKELDDALRSLGLRPRTTTLKSNAARDDQSHGLKESRRTRPPAEYAEQSKAYSQGTARGKQ